MYIENNHQFGILYSHYYLGKPLPQRFALTLNMNIPTITGCTEEDAKVLSAGPKQAEDWFYESVWLRVLRDFRWTNKRDGVAYKLWVTSEEERAAATDEVGIGIDIWLIEEWMKAPLTEHDEYASREVVVEFTPQEMRRMMFAKYLYETAKITETVEELQSVLR